MSANKEQVERRAQTLGQPHFAVSWPNGTITIHARPGCSGMKIAPPVLPDIVDLLWEANPDRLSWCQNCAVRRVRTKKEG